MARACCNMHRINYAQLAKCKYIFHSTQCSIWLMLVELRRDDELCAISSVLQLLWGKTEKIEKRRHRFWLRGALFIRLLGSNHHRVASATLNFRWWIIIIKHQSQPHCAADDDNWVMKCVWKVRVILYIGMRFSRRSVSRTICDRDVWRRENSLFAFPFAQRAVATCLTLFLFGRSFCLWAIRLYLPNLDHRLVDKESHTILWISISLTRQQIVDKSYRLSPSKSGGD